MNHRKNLIKDLLNYTIQTEFDENTSLSNFSDVAVDALIQEIDALVIRRAFGILPGGIAGTSKNVVCEMPNNQHTSAKSICLQCQNPRCSEYFCKNHSINVCPLCADILK